MLCIGGTAKAIGVEDRKIAVIVADTEGVVTGIMELKQKNIITHKKILVATRASATTATGIPVEDKIVVQDPMGAIPIRKIVHLARETLIVAQEIQMAKIIIHVLDRGDVEIAL